MPAIIRHVAITGRVQGVGYRAWLVDEATSRGLSGWARNRRDGSVEAVLSGPEDAIDDMVARCRGGPSMARVTGVEVRDAVSVELTLRGPETFAVLPTL